jgi:hypothetical protein
MNTDKNYLIKFFYNTDCRCEYEQKAPSELAALAILVYDHPELKNWADNGKQFYVKLSLA